MKLLIADDDTSVCGDLGRLLSEDGFQVMAVGNGLTAWDALKHDQGPRLGLLDWMMPGLDGPELCRRARQELGSRPPFLILLTARASEEDILRGLESGADEYLTKPVSYLELRARLEVGRRIISLQDKLTSQVAELKEALSSVKQLQGLLPICMYCKKVRDNLNYWQQVEAYIAAHSEAEFSHGICPDCYESVVLPELAQMDNPDSKQS